MQMGNEWDDEEIYFVISFYPWLRILIREKQGKE